MSLYNSRVMLEFIVMLWNRIRAKATIPAIERTSRMEHIRALEVVFLLRISLRKGTPFYRLGIRWWMGSIFPSISHNQSRTQLLRPPPSLITQGAGITSVCTGWPSTSMISTIRQP